MNTMATRVSKYRKTRAQTGSAGIILTFAEIVASAHFKRKFELYDAIGYFL